MDRIMTTDEDLDVVPWDDEEEEEDEDLDVVPWDDEDEDWDEE